MPDVTTITTSQDSADKWRAALERMIAHPNLGRQIVFSQFVERETFACLDCERWEITDRFDTAISAEVMFPLPMLRLDVAWIYQAILIEDIATNSGIFARCWRNSPAAQDCADEMRKQLEEHIKLMRNITAEIRLESSRTGKLIA